MQQYAKQLYTSGLTQPWRTRRPGASDCHRHEEQEPLSFQRLKTISAALVSGDYSVAGLEELFAIERKTVSDLVGCCMGDSRQRFERELHRLRGFRFKRLLVVGTKHEIEAGQYHSNIEPKAVLATLSAFEVRYDLPVVLCPCPEIAARQIESWAYWFAREIVETVNDIRRNYGNARTS